MKLGNPFEEFNDVTGDDVNDDSAKKMGEEDAITDGRHAGKQ